GIVMGDRRAGFEWIGRVEQRMIGAVGSGTETLQRVELNCHCPGILDSSAVDVSNVNRRDGDGCRNGGIGSHPGGWTFGITVVHDYGAHRMRVLCVFHLAFEGARICSIATEPWASVHQGDLGGEVAQRRRTSVGVGRNLYRAGRSTAVERRAKGSV